MSTDNHIKTSRAVGSEFVKRKLSGVTTVIAILSAVFLALGIWLTTVSAWWWILLVVVIAWILLGVLLLAVAWFATKLLRPQMNADQRHAVSEFVDKLERVSETIQITPFMIFFRILKDMLFPPEKLFIRQMADDSTSLHSDYIALAKLFS